MACQLVESKHVFRLSYGYSQSDLQTNAIESLNCVIRHATKKRKIFPTDDSVKKVVYLAIMAASKKWTMPIQNWKAAMNRFSIMFEERVTKYF